MKRTLELFSSKNMITAKQRLAMLMKHPGIFITLVISSILFISCSDDEVENKTNPKYEAEHVLIVDKIEASGFGAIMVTGTFNISYDPSISEIGFILTNNQDNRETRKKLNLEQLQSKETVLFNNLSDGNYSVKAYIVHRDNNEINSQSKSISLITNMESDYYLSCLFDYVNKDGKPVLSVNNNDYISISLICKNPLVSEKVYFKLSDKIFEMNFIESTGWTDDLRHYYIDGRVTEDMPVGENNIELIFQDQVSFDSGIILDKLSGKWKELKSLYTGDLKGGTKVSFQNERYGFLVQIDVHYVSSTELQVWGMDFTSLQWQKMSSLKLTEHIHVLYPTSITKEEKAYIIFTTYNAIQIWEYDMRTDVWNRKMKLEERQLPYDPIIFAHKDKFYIIGGRYFDSDEQIYFLSDRQWVYDIADNSIEESKNSTNMIEMFDGYYYSTFESEEYTYIMSSYHNNVWKYKILRYSESNQSFEKVESPYVLISAKGVGYTFNNRIYYVGGISDYGAHQYCYTYSEDSNEWLQIADFPYRIAGGIVFKFNSKAYVGLGNGFYDTSITLHSWEK